MLVERAGCITTAAMLRQMLWGDAEGGTVKSVNAYVRAIRLKLEQDPDRPVILTTESGIGYRWMCVEPMGSAT
jgi:DNA-binding response OmpR family regulator